MKTIGTILISALTLLPWCLNTAYAQDKSQEGEKKIVITKRTVDPDGTETTETIIKTGQAAEDFDVEQYINENQADNVELDVRVQDTENDRNVVIRHRNNNSTGTGWVKGLENHVNVIVDDVASWVNEDRGFLGVTQKGSNNADRPGVQVNIVKESGAAAAGLQDGDVLLQLDDAPINTWDDITQFMRETEPDDKVQVTYERNGQKNTTEVTLKAKKIGSSFDMDFDSDFNMDKVIVKTKHREKDACLGVYSSSFGEGDARGSKVSDFMSESAAREAEMEKGDVITAVNGVRVKSHDDLWNEIAKYQVGDKVSVDFLREGESQQIEAELKACRSTSNSLAPDVIKYDIKVREKDACLGVYSSAFTKGDSQGASITGFTKESAAKESEMEVGDLITSVNGIEVKGHDQLWDEIAKYKVGETVSVAFMRGDQSQQIEAELKACRNKSNRVTLFEMDENAVEPHREFFTWDWNDEDQNHLRRHRVITIHRGTEGDAAEVEPVEETPAATDRSGQILKLDGFRAYPNPSQGQVTVEFHSEPLPTIVSLLDMSGRQLFREELNAFSGDYFQQFDLSEYAKGTIIIHVLQDGKVFTEQLIVN